MPDTSFSNACLRLKSAATINRNARVDRLTVELVVKRRDRQASPLVVESSPLGVDDHKLARVLALLLELLDLGGAKLLDGRCAVNVRAIRAGAKDGTNDCRSVLV